ncbi:DUF5342 family protein [Bacillus aerolatus]|uniref:DUF5342 family protein n=1 Tax=Bacillus aerolatus TaxID=2653354 RepID=UPI001781684E|nr:DUF5342 family protein [Bacillus aerolatus]
MFSNFKVKKLFENQIHERHQFSINIKGYDYQGIYRDGEINWFHPMPIQTLEENQVDAIECKVHQLMSKSIEATESKVHQLMGTHFEVKKLFENQIHERHQFSMNIEGNDYRGIYRDGEINWFNPMPIQTLKEIHFEAIESKVHELMEEYFEQ